jgi:hypothetical protein
MGSEGGPFTVGVGEDAWGVVGEVGVGLVAGSVEVGVGEGRGGGSGRGGGLVLEGWKRRRWAKKPRPPRWSTVKGRRVMWAELMAWMMA